MKGQVKVFKRFVCECGVEIGGFGSDNLCRYDCPHDGQFIAERPKDSYKIHVIRQEVIEVKNAGE